MNARAAIRRLRLRARVRLVAVAAPLLALLLGVSAVEPAFGAPPALVVSHGTAARHAVALTFDDAWDPAATRTVFEILRDEDVAATFFPTAVGVSRDPGLWRTIAEAGYVIGDHTVTHPDLTTLSSTAAADEIAGARATIERAIGRPMAPLLRPPNGAVDDRIRRIAATLGFGTVVLWDVASWDWAEPNGALVADRSLAGTDGSIVLLHAGPASTIAALPSIVAGYRARGFDLVTVPELLGG